MEKKFIKVTLKGEKKSVIVPAANEAFYRNQKATIEKPTDEEVMEARPEVRRAKVAADNLAKSKQKAKAENEVLKAENASLKAENEALKAENASLKAENEALKKKLEKAAKPSKTEK